jgi:hypothetical protein
MKELWKARENENSSAAEEIANKMKNLMADRLRQHGIQLLNAKANLPSKDEKKEKKESGTIGKSQIAAWSMEWEKQRAMSLANGRAKSERIQQEARAYAHSVLLTAVAEGLQQARSIHHNLPRYLIALRFIGAIEAMIQQQPETDEKEKLEAVIQNAKSHLLSSHPKE